jgi:catechol 2,3-dioxygenase-like lactoylglutathione lyase family enzyme
MAAPLLHHRQARPVPRFTRMLCSPWRAGEQILPQEPRARINQDVADWRPTVRYHLGRLFDHVHLRVADLEASRRFYRAALGALGTELAGESADHFWVDELYVSADGPATTGLHLAFQAGDRAAVERFHRAAIEAGGRDNGAPGERSYGPGYYAAYALDPDGNNVEAVIHEHAQRSATAIDVELPVDG